MKTILYIIGQSDIHNRYGVVVKPSPGTGPCTSIEAAKSMRELALLDPNAHHIFEMAVDVKPVDE